MIKLKRANPGALGGVFAACLLLALAGCGADKAFTPTVTSAPQQIAPTETAASAATAVPGDVIAVSVILTEYRIAVFTNGFEVGKTYKFTVSNNGAVAHGFTIEPAGANNQPLTANGKTAAIPSIGPGQTQIFTWTFTTVGKLQIASHLNDDYAKGMVKTGLAAS